VLASGIKKLVYFEPYPESKDLLLHSDSIVHQSPKAKTDGRVLFQPFIEIGPRRFFDLFSIWHGAGLDVKRASKGKYLRGKLLNGRVIRPILNFRCGPVIISTES